MIRFSSCILFVVYPKAKSFSYSQRPIEIGIENLARERKVVKSEYVLIARRLYKVSSRSRRENRLAALLKTILKD